MMPHLGRPRERLSTGLRWGFVYAAACSAVAVTSVLIRGPAVLKPYHVGVLGMIALYFGSGLVGGSVFGLLMPLGQTLGSAEFVWMCAAVSLLGPACGAAFWIRKTGRR